MTPALSVLRPSAAPRTPARLLAVLAVATLLVFPAAGAFVAPGGVDRSLEALPPATPAAASDAVRDALARHEDAVAFRLGMETADGLADRLALAAARAGIDLGAPPAVPVRASFSEALADLADVTGLPFEGDVAALEALPAEAKAPLLDLVAAAAVAGRLRASAFADLSPSDLAYVQGVAGDLALRPERLAEPRLQALAGSVDLGALAEGAYVVLDAIDRDAPLLAASSASAAPAIPPPAADPGCLPFAPGPAFSLSPLLAVGGPGPECFTLDYALSVDLGGNDLYLNNAGGTRSGLLGTIPVAVALDLDGDDAYHSQVAGGPAPAPVLQGVEGAGVVGVGVLVDVLGDDAYHSNLALPCGVPFGDVLDQGAGLLGVGALADLDGKNAFSSSNTVGGPACLVPASYTVSHSQGSGFLLGVGLLVNAATDVNTFNSDNSVTTAQGAASYLVDHSQGAASLVAVGGLVALPRVVMLPDGSFVLGAPNRFNSGNTVTYTGPFNAFSVGTYTVQCSQGAAGTCGGHPVLADALVQPVAASGPVAVGFLVDGWDLDDYNCDNQVGGGYRPTFLVHVAQGAAGADGFLDAGLFVSTDTNCLNSWNAVTGESAAYAVKVVQGAAETALDTGFVRVGVFAGVLANDGRKTAEFNSYNTVLAPNFGIPTIEIDLAQGAASGTLAVGAHVTVGDPLFGQPAHVHAVYNSYNTVVGPASDRMDVLRMQGFASGTLAAGVLANVDLPEATIEYNSYNAPGTFVPAFVVLSVTKGLGHAQGFLSVGAFVDAGGQDTYNVNPLLGAADYTLAQVYAFMPAGALGAALFADLATLGPDAYHPAPACTGPLAVFVDAADGPDAPPLPAALTCIDR